jgi:small subunit ribosomal protein S6
MLNQDQTTEAWSRIKEFITSRNGEITQEQSWGTRRLAYPIHRGTYHFLEGAYQLTRFSTEQPFNQELENFLRVDDRVLRSLVIATEKAGPYPTPMSPQAPRPAPVAPAPAPAAPEASAEDAADPVAAAAETVAESAAEATSEAPEASSEAEAAPEAEEEAAAEPEGEEDQTQG